MNKIPAKKIKQYYKRFANGEQYIELNPITGEIVNQDKQYYWQQRGVYNKVQPLLAVYSKDLTEEQLYGKTGLVSLLEPWQRKYNSIMNAHDEHLVLTSCGYMFVEDGSVDVDDLSEEGLAPGKVLVYRQGSHPPVFEKPVLNNEPYFEAADYCYNQMIQICNMFVSNIESKKVQSDGYLCECEKEHK
jgi:hypothetical protein